VFSTAQPPAIAAAATAALAIVAAEPERRRNLLTRAGILCEELRALGLNVGQAESQIIPVTVGDSGRTMQVGAALRERGVFVPGIRPPTVPDGESLLRISLCYGHTEEMITALVTALKEEQRNC
jgi:8-amino-7-oxononanoate synthase